jgi:hypothetical protein
MTKHLVHATQPKHPDHAEAKLHVAAWQTPGPKVGFLNYHSLPLLKDQKNMYPIFSVEPKKNFDVRKYIPGLMHGPYVKQPDVAVVALPSGTAGSRAIHLAGILGCSEVHTIGFDLCFKRPDHHHWYEFPIYHTETVRTEKMFTEYKGFQTQWIWIETAQWLMELREKYLTPQGLKWIDHSNGLIDHI